MAESFVERRKREKGLTVSSQDNAPSASGIPDNLSFVERRKMERGLAPGKTPNMIHSDENAQYAEAMKQAYQNNPDSFAKRPPKEPDSRPDLRTDYPGGVFNPVNDLNWLRKTPVGQTVDRFAQGIGHSIGLQDDQMSSPASSGNQIVDKVAGIAGETVGYLVNPGMPVGNLGVAANFFDHPVLQHLAEKLGNKVQGALPDAGLAVSKDGIQIIDSLAGKTVNRAVQGAVQGGAGAAAYAPFHTLATGGDVQDIPAKMLEEGLYGAGFGGVLSGLSPAASRIVRMIKDRNMGPAPTSQEAFDQATRSRTTQQSQNPHAGQGQEFADRFNFINQRTGEYRDPNIPQLPPSRIAEAQARAQGVPQPYGESPIATPYTFGLPEANNATMTHQNNVQDALGAIKEIDDQLRQIENSYQQATIDQYKLLKSQRDNRGGVDQGGLIKDSNGDVIGRTGRISNNPEWFQNFYSKNGRAPTNKDLYSLAKEHVDNGYQDNGIDIPSWIDENSYHDTRTSLQQTRDEISGWIKDNGLGITDAELKEQKFGRARPSTKNEAKVEVIPPQRKFAPSTEQTMPISPPPEGRVAGSGTVRNVKRQGKPKSDPVTEQNFNAAESQASDATQNYAGNVIPYRQAATQSERTINRNKVVSNLKKNLGVVIDTGKLKRMNKKGKIVPAQKGTLGQYKITPEVIRTRMAEDLQVISHEVGHHLDKKHALQDPRFQSEYVKILQNNPVLNVAAYAPDQLPGEAIAEYVRLRLTDPVAARRLAPKYSAYFDSKVPPKVLKGLEASQKDIDTWITQGDYNQAKGLIDFESGSKKEPFNKDKFYTRFVDDLNPLKLAEQALKGAVGKGADSIYKMARLSRGIAERAKMAVTRGIYDSQGKKVVDGLREIVKPLEKLGIKEEDFALYLAVKHAKDLRDKFGKQIPFDDAQIKAVLGKLDTPEVQAVQKEVIKYNNALLDILVDAQIISQKAVNEMRTKYPNYVPLMRYFDEDSIAGFKSGGFGAAKGFANITNPIKAMSEEGSTRTVINPIESMVKNTFLVMNAAAKNKVGLQLSELAKIEGAGAWVEHIGPGGRDAKDHVIAVWVNGEKQSYKIREPELYNAMLSLDTESANSLIKFLGGAASLLRAGATLTPEFTIRNAMRDVIGATINSTKYGFNPLDFFKGLFHVVSKTQTFDQFISSGGAMGTMQALDRDASREALKAVFTLSLKDKTMNIVSSPKELAKLLSGYTPAKAIVGGLRKAAEISELSTKVGAFNKTLKKTGSLEEAAFTAKDLMDFNRAGSSIRQANRAVAFLNASIQGTDRMARAFKDNKAGFLVRAFTTLVLPAAGLHYWIHNLPDDKKKIYDNIPQWQKDSFFIIPGPGDTFFRMPKPFEAGMLFATGTERALRWLADNDPDAYKQYGSSVLEAMTPPVMFSALTPLLEAITNHSFFRDAPIVPQGEQGLEKKDQYGLFTSETSKQAGNLISMIPGLSDSNAASPRIIDNTIKGYTAGLGQYGVQALDTVLNAIMGDSGPPKPAKQWNEKPPVSSFLATTSGGGQVRQDFYDKWDKLTKAKNSADRNEVVFTDPEYGRMKGAYNTITKLNKQYKAIQKDRAISAQDKRSQLDELDGKMNDIAAKGLGK